MKFFGILKTVITLKRIIVIAVVCLLSYVSFAQIPLARDSAYASHSQILQRFDATSRSELLLLDYNGNVHHVSRELTRDGERVCVVFFYCTKPLLGRLIDSVFLTDPVFRTTVLAERAAGDDLQMVEVYYLSANYSNISELSDESFDAKRFDGFLIWSELI